MIKLKVGNQTLVSVDVEPGKKFRKKGKQDEIIAKFDDLLHIVKSIGNELETTMDEISNSLKEFELSIGFEINAEGNFLISKIGVKSQIQGKFTWALDK